MSRENILLAMPCYGMVTPQTTLSIAQLVKHPKVKAYTYSVGQPTYQVRNDIARTFLRHQFRFTHLMMIDSDNTIPDGAVDKLLECHSDIAVGIYPLLTGRQDIIENSVFVDTWKDAPFDVDKFGAGCLLVKREAFESIEPPWFQWPGTYMTDDPTRMSDDIYFAKKAAKAGFSIKAHPGVLCDHIKPVSLLNLCEPGKMKICFKEE